MSIPPKSELPAADHEQWIVSTKRALRRRIRSLREALPPSVVAARSQKIVARLLEHPWVSNAGGVGLFWPMQERREVDLRSLDEQLRARDIRIYYPFMCPSSDGSITTCFRRVIEPDDLVLQGQRFHMPIPTSPLAERGDVDVIVVPALAATPTGQRLGYGSGFYDVTLPDLCPPAHSVTVAYDFQMLIELPEESHDIRCDAVVTDTSTYIVRDTSVSVPANPR